MNDCVVCVYCFNEDQKKQSNHFSAPSTVKIPCICEDRREGGKEGGREGVMSDAAKLAENVGDNKR